MKFKLLFWTFFVFLGLFGLAVNGQNVDELSNLKLLQVAEDAFFESDYLKAIECYEEYLDRKPTSSKVGFELATTYSKIKDYENAMRWYKLLYEQDVNRNILALLSFGKMAMASGDVHLAKRSFERFKREFDPNDDQKHIKKLNGFYLDGIAMFEAEYDSMKVSYSSAKELKNVYNHPFDTGNKVVFLKEEDEKKGINYLDDLINLLNTQEDKIPESFFSPDGEQYFFSKYDKNSKDKYIASLYHCTKVDGAWQNCTKLPLTINHEEYSSILPTVAKNTKNGELVIYFVSDRPEGKGGWDIWYAEFNSRKGGFREPKNLGSKVNTAGNELSPYYDREEGVLYFSSDGWPGFGSQDIFWIKGEGRSWEECFNLGTEINTNYDEYFFTRFDNAYFWASNRIKTNNEYSPHFYDDFFKTYFLTRIREETITAKQKKEKEEIKQQEIVEEKIVKEEIEKDDVGDENKFDIEEVSDSVVKVTLYHEFDEADLVDDFLAIIDNYIISKTKKPGLKQIKITSYTDNFGTVAYNKVLSTNRAKYVCDYLISKGISRKIIEYTGKGESEPAAPNEKPDGSDNPEGRKLNRRTVIEAFVK